MMPGILVVEDEEHILELIRFNLQKEGFQVLGAGEGYEALKIAEREKPDLIILDIMLPGISGLEICRHLRKNDATEDIPIIMISAKNEELDKVLGLEIGADDYLTKPFSPRELIARVKARLRKFTNRVSKENESKNDILLGHIVIKPEKFEVWVNGIKQEFTLKEFELLKLMVTNPGKVFTREFLLDKIWGFDYSHDTRTVDVHIRHLRLKVEPDPSNPVYIETIRGIGYKFREITS
jgi:two-component system alkaline phosphatase synthesis response regulator PhoP